MIALQHASVRYGDTLALDDFTGSFPAGAVTALVGGDGAGKSTLLRTLSGRVAATPPQPAPASRAAIGYQPADSGVWRGLSVEENLAFVARVHGLDPAVAAERSARLLRSAGLEQARGRVAARLSGGMRQKLGFLLATLHRPELVLLDEPTTGVDPVSRGELWMLIAAAAAEGATVVFATTYLDEAERAEGVFLLAEGRVLASGTPAEVVARVPGAADLEQASIALLRDGPGRAAARTAASGDRREGGPRSTPASSSATSAPTPEPAHAVALAASATVPAEHAGSPVLLRADSVARSYGQVAALRQVSIAVAAGEIVGLLGGNGAGKSTLIRIILGLEHPTAGSCTLFGRAPSLTARRRIGYVAQGIGLYPSLSAIENLRFAASVHGVAVPEPAAGFARRFGSHPVGALPLGARRELAYLAAVQHRPQLLVLDEPTSGMDPLARAELWRQLRAHADAGAGVLVTTHYMQEAARCDRLVILDAGSVAAAGTVAQITAARTSTEVRAQRWQSAFALLREAGLPVALSGRSLRVPGVAPEAVAAVLATLPDEVELRERPSTLEETMLLASARP